MSKEAVSKFVRTIVQHFPPFRWDEEQEATWVDTMLVELSGFSATVLDHAMHHMVRGRRARRGGGRGRH
jgi:hypothetical protein